MKSFSIAIPMMSLSVTPHQYDFNQQVSYVKQGCISINVLVT